VFVVSHVVFALLSWALTESVPANRTLVLNVGYGGSYALLVLGPLAYMAIERKWSMLTGFIAVPLSALLLVGGCALAFSFGR